MPQAACPVPLRHGPGFERPGPGAADTTEGLVETMRGIAETTFADGGTPLRSVHAKSHGLLQGEMTVAEGLPAILAQGLFAKPGTYRVVLRFSTNPGDILNDSVSVPRGLAVKVVGRAGGRLPGSEGAATQDFVLVNSPAFAAASAKQFLGNARLLARTTDWAPGAKKVLSAVLRGTEAALEAVGGKSAMLTQLGGRPNALREEVAACFAVKEACWELRVQFCTDRETMPIEDPSVPWPEKASPHLPVARITVPPQPSWDGTRSRAVDLGLAFSPWHGLAAHRPLGAVNRARKPAHEMSAGFRAAHGGCPMQEPRNAAEVPI